MKTILLVATLGFFLVCTAFSQGVKIGSGSPSPNPSAILDLEAPDLGFLPPRMTSEERDAIPAPVPTGLTIFNTTTNCTNVFNGTSWYALCGECVPGVPGVPGAITGSAEVCPGTSGLVYSISAVPLASSYSWTVPPGWTITSGGTGTSITVTAGGTGQNGFVTVAAQNACGAGASSSLPVAISPAPPTAATHSAGETQIVWNWNAVPGATGYRYSTTNNFATATATTATTFTQTGLACGTTFTLYVWSVNACGNSTPATLSATTVCFVCGTSVINDSRDGNVYTTVQIGTRCWMKENLRYLPAVSPPSTLSNTAIHYYVYGYSGSDVNAAKATSNYATYGVLYNWNAAMQTTATTAGTSANPSTLQGACPTGWHLPSDTEWQSFEVSLGMSAAQAAGSGFRGTDEGDKLKSATGWNASPGNGNNSTGFTGLPGGYMNGATAAFEMIGQYCSLWTATLVGGTGNNPWFRYLYIPQINRNNSLRRDGYSVRCVRN